jgi:hypothetical protein
MFSTFYFDKNGCELGLQRLAGYHYEYSAKNGIYSQHPKHDENSHGSDAFQYACMSLEALKNDAQSESGAFTFKTFIPKEFSDYSK